ncbi:MAG: hypothetical protein KCHDKBKB_02259 [Elusimicrobia bacterium]|nr:hypothetical protein [Elusimicrobiota bacterium]
MYLSIVDTIYYVINNLIDIMINVIELFISINLFIYDIL